MPTLTSEPPTSPGLGLRSGLRWSPLTVVEVLLDPTVNCLEPRLNVPAPAIEPKEVPPVVRSAILTSPPALLMTRRLIAAARAVETKKSAFIDNECRMVSCARIMEIRRMPILTALRSSHDQRVLLSKNCMKPALNPGFWTGACSDCRCASTCCCF